MMVNFESVVSVLRAAGEASRLRILCLLRQGELSVGELVEILGQSQPGVSQHLKTLLASGLVERLPEGAFVYYHLTQTPGLFELVDGILDRVDLSEGDLQRDQVRLDEIQKARAATADDYFERIAKSWDDIRAAHYPDLDVEAAILEAVGQGPYRQLVDIGTGTGRMLNLLAPFVTLAEGVDRNHEMLTVARSNLARASLSHARVRKGDATALPYDSGFADLVMIHQVLHYSPRPVQVISEAARILKPGGRLIIVDFAPHTLEFLRDEHAHQHLGLSYEDLHSWVRETGLTIRDCNTLEPDGAQGLTVQVLSIEKSSFTKEAAA